MSQATISRILIKPSVKKPSLVMVGLWLAVASPLRAQAPSINSSGDSVSLMNGNVRLDFNLATGRYRILSDGGQHEVISQAKMRINDWSSDDVGLERSWRQREIDSPGSKALALELSFKAADRPEMVFSFTLQDGRNDFSASGGIVNDSNQAVIIRDIHVMADALVHDGTDMTNGFAMIDGFSGGDGKASLLAYLDLPQEKTDHATGGESLKLLQGAGKVTWHGHEFRCREIATSVDEPKQITIEAAKLQPDRPYTLGFSWWRSFQHGNKPDLAQSMFVEYEADGVMKRLPLVENHTLPRFDGESKDDVEQVEMALPAGAICAGKLQIVVENVKFGEETGNVFLNEIWLRDGRSQALLPATLSSVADHARPRRTYTAELFAADPVGKRVDAGARYIAPDQFYIDVVGNDPFVALEQGALRVREAQQIKLSMYDFPTVCLWYAWKGEPVDTDGEMFTTWEKAWTRNGRLVWGYDFTDPDFLAHMHGVYANLKRGGVRGLMFDYPASGWARAGGMEDQGSTTAAAYRTIFRLAHDGLGPESYVHERNMERGSDITLGVATSSKTCERVKHA